MVYSKTPFSGVKDLKYVDVSNPDAWPNIFMARYYGADRIYGTEDGVEKPPARSIRATFSEFLNHFHVGKSTATVRLFDTLSAVCNSRILRIEKCCL